jgi:hypothetical protein
MDHVLALDNRFLPPWLSKTNRRLRAALAALHRHAADLFSLRLDRCVDAVYHALAHHPASGLAHHLRAVARYQQNLATPGTAGQVHREALAEAATDATRAVDLFAEDGTPAEAIASAWRQKRLIREAGRELPLECQSTSAAARETADARQ